MKYHFFSGFEAVDWIDSANFTSKSGSIQSTIVKKGVYAGDNENNENFIKTLDTAVTTVVMSGWFRWSVDVGSGNLVMLGYGATAGQFYVATNVGYLYVYVHGSDTNYLTSTNKLVKDTWYFIELKFVVHDTTGSFELRLDGETILSRSNIDTKGTDASLTQFRWQGINTTGHCYVDECGLSDDFPSNYEQVIGVSKTGVDIKEASVHQLKFGSSFNTLKIRQKQYQQIVTNGAGVGSATIAHNLGYKPAFMIYTYRATTNTLDGISYSHANFITGSCQFCPFYDDPTRSNPSLLDVFATADISNINIKITNGGDSSAYRLYIYIFSDIAEETNQTKTFSGNDYGLRVSQPGYDVKTDPDYRMIYTSKDSVFHIAKTGEISLTIPAITLNDGEEDLVKTEVLFSSIGVSSGYHPYMVMVKDYDIYYDDAIWLRGGFVPWLPFTGLPDCVSHAGIFCTNDRIVCYGWRSYVNMGGGASGSWTDVVMRFRYMIFNETMTFS